MKKIFGVLAVVLMTATSAQAVVTAPSLYYGFDNDDGESAGTYDGLLEEEMGTGLHIWNNERNGGAQPFSFIVAGGSSCSGYPGCEGGSAAAPNEHYVPGAPNTGGGTAHHFEGGTSREYDASSAGSANLDVQTDSVVDQINDVGSRRDMGRLGGPSAGNFAAANSSGGPNGGILTYGFWLNVQLATNVQDGTRFGTGSSFVIGRGSGGPGHGGEVSIRDGGGAGLDYKLQVRNDGGPNGIQQTSAVYNNGEWHHFVIEYDLTGATGTVTIWADGGTLAGGTKEVLTGFGNSSIQGNTYINQVGHPGASFMETGDFYLDDLAYWTGVKLTDGEVQEIYNVGVAAAIVPEPSSFILAGFGLVGLAFAGWRRRRS